jgi:RNA polymerase sigma-70 factor (ECF subfamily)
LEQTTEKPSNEKEIDWQDAYYQSFPKIFHFFCYKVGDPILAEELTAITFEKGWRSRGNFRKGANVHGWLVGIARHVASDHFRKKSRVI